MTSMPTISPKQRRWRPSPLLAITFVLHATCAIAIVVALVAMASGEDAPWPGQALHTAIAALVLNHVGLTLAGLWPRSSLLGPNRTRLPTAATARGEVAITIDDGPDPAVTPAVLDQLEAASAKATFFVIAERAVRHPALIARIVAAGHSIGNHSDRHSHRFSFSGPRAFDAEIGHAQRRLAALTGRAPRYFRAPAGLRNPFLEPVLCRHGLVLASWTRRGFDTRSGDADIVFARLAGGRGERLSAGDILLLHDGHAARTPDGTPVILAVLPRLLAACATQRLKPVTLEAADAPASGPAEVARRSQIPTSHAS